MLGPLHFVFLVRQPIVGILYTGVTLVVGVLNNRAINDAVLDCFLDRLWIVSQNELDI